jgi:hypothetical protein
MKNRTPEIRIITIREQKVVLDVDLARIYGVTTKRLNEQLRRNRKRFPDDFAFQLTADEFESLRSQIATLEQGTPVGETKRSQTATTSGKRRRKTHRPWVFTEHGALQAANAAILKRLAEIDKTLLEHDTALRDIYQKLLPLLARPREPPRRQIGFHAAS